MEGKFALAVYSGHEGAPLRIDANVHPGRSMWYHLVELGSACIYCVHAAAHEIALDTRFAGVMKAKLFARATARTIGADHVIGFNTMPAAVFKTLNINDDLAASVCEGLHAPAIVDADARQLLRVLA